MKKDLEIVITIKDYTREYIAKADGYESCDKEEKPEIKMNRNYLCDSEVINHNKNSKSIVI